MRRRRCIDISKSVNYVWVWGGVWSLLFIVLEKSDKIVLIKVVAFLATFRRFCANPDLVIVGSLSDALIGRVELRGTKWTVVDFFMVLSTVDRIWWSSPVLKSTSPVIKSNVVEISPSLIESIKEFRGLVPLTTLEALLVIVFFATWVVSPGVRALSRRVLCFVEIGSVEYTWMSDVKCQILRFRILSYSHTSNKVFQLCYL